MFLTDFDGSKAIIEPENFIDKLEDFPEICLGVFSHVLVEQWIQQHPSEIIARIKSVSGDRAVYKISVDGHDFALFVPYVGAPAAVGDMEELIARGAKKFVFCGCCGVLRHDIADGHLIIPTAAIRDEGTSFHYLEASDEIALDPGMINIASSVLRNLGLPYTMGKVWTTDAFYRETRKKMELAKSMGALCVDMECSALTAVSQFRNIPCVQFFWSADNLDTTAWDKRNLDNKGLHVSEVCFLAALEIAKKFATQAEACI